MLRKHNIILVILLGILATGCKKYLDVKPEDKFTEYQVFSNEVAIQQALNQLYINLVTDTLYGANLTTTALEVLGRRYNISGSHQLDNVLSYNTTAATGTTFDVIWRKAYANILSANLFISQLDGAQTNGVITPAHSNILKGEAIAIRAMLHFDMLRLYGPVYSSDSIRLSIPYQKTPKVEVSALLPANVVMNEVIADLAEAELLLAQDPIVSSGVTPLGTEIDFYSTLRNRRLNYYAVLGLEARAQLYRGSNTAAHAAARKMLDEGEQWFGWMDFSAIVGAVIPDRIFSPEVLLGLYNSRMYNMQSKYFASTLNAYDILAPLPDRLDQIFESNVNDYRFNTTWNDAFGGFKSFYKYADVSSPTAGWRYMQPLLRKSEIYYILAETDPDPAQALEYLNTVRLNRGLPDLTLTNLDMEGEIRKEYVREFFGEGQLYFFYKRKNITEVPEPTQPYDWWTTTIDFSLPLPESETTLR